ncbi:hypothetical protein F444_17407 [Phytophthora nicotianae P1976]|uniref:Uncharacterized protein n=1 Tax=Phytophthora nicotianae P1976 TaxID=1317066 RepID=A0A080ZF73_PHYNI|nr:hypothetical protein F444_17407 [Phytophthora nicotianae P1976]
MPAPTHLNITHLGSRRVTTTISKLIESNKAPQGEHHRVDSEEGSSAFSDSSSDKGEYGSSNESADATFHLAGQFFARDDDKFKVCRVTKSSNVFTVRAANISVGTYTVISFNGQGWVRL